MTIEQLIRELERIEKDGIGHREIGMIFKPHLRNLLRIAKAAQDFNVSSFSSLNELLTAVREANGKSL